MKRVCVLGSTGSIGVSALEVARSLTSDLEVAGLTAGANHARLAEQVARFRPRVAAVGVGDPADALVRAAREAGTELLSGPEGVRAVASLAEADVVLNGLVGAVGLLPSMAALEAGKDLALANKETMVVGGDLVLRAAKESGAAILPVDSEHAALHQCLAGRPEPRRVFLTASGGPFRELPTEALAGVTADEALRHPTWDMGRKITIDSATLMNKGLEVIEAHLLFDLPIEKVEVVVHPQSVVHAMVEFEDGNFLAQLGPPDMRLPIQYALTWPDRTAASWPRLEPGALARLDFEPPDLDRFPCLALGYRAAREGGAAPAALNAANEVLVEAFLAGEISFPDIADGIGAVLNDHSPTHPRTVDDILEVDRAARRSARQWLRTGAAIPPTEGRPVGP